MRERDCDMTWLPCLSLSGWEVCLARIPRALPWAEGSPPIRVMLKNEILSPKDSERSAQRNVLGMLSVRRTPSAQPSATSWECFLSEGLRECFGNTPLGLATHPARFIQGLPRGVE